MTKRQAACKLNPACHALCLFHVCETTHTWSYARILYIRSVYIYTFSSRSLTCALTRAHPRECIIPIKEKKNRARGLFVVIEFDVESHERTSSATVLKTHSCIPHVLLPIRSANRASTRERLDRSLIIHYCAHNVSFAEMTALLSPSPSPFLPLIAPRNTITSRRSRSRLSPRARCTLFGTWILLSRNCFRPSPPRTQRVFRISRRRAALLPHLRPDKNTARIRP